MDGHDDNLIRNALRSLDFSKDNPKLKDRLSRKLDKHSRLLSDDELDLVSAAGDPDSHKNGISPEK